ncbi:4196_t:CDS:1, partial [Racocetra persica]
MSCKCKFNKEIEYCCYHYPELINKKQNVDESHITFIMSFEQALIQYYSRNPQQITHEEILTPNLDIFNRLKQEIERTQRPDAIKLIDNEYFDKKI